MPGSGYLVACRTYALLNDHVVHWLVIHTQNECCAVLLIVGGLAVCQAGTSLQAAGRAYTSIHSFI